MECARQPSDATATRTSDETTKSQISGRLSRGPSNRHTTSTRCRWTQFLPSYASMWAGSSASVTGWPQLGALAGVKNNKVGASHDHSPPCARQHHPTAPPGAHRLRTKYKHNAANHRHGPRQRSMSPRNRGSTGLAPAGNGAAVCNRHRPLGETGQGLLRDGQRPRFTHTTTANEGVEVPS